MKNFALLMCSLLSFTLPLSAPAQTEQKPAPLVQIEVIIFQSLALRGWTEEFWPDSPELPNVDGATFFNSKDNYAKRLPTESLTLHEDIAKMTPEKGYEVLAHFGWQQPALPRDQALPILIDQTAQQHRLDSSILYGSVRMYQERFAHIEVDLELDRTIPQAIRERFAEHQQEDVDWMTEGWRFPLKEARRVRFGQLHYLDHPIYGVLIKVDQVKK